MNTIFLLVIVWSVMAILNIIRVFIKGLDYMAEELSKATDLFSKRRLKQFIITVMIVLAPLMFLRAIVPALYRDLWLALERKKS